jgi:hypothetical protein
MASEMRRNNDKDVAEKTPGSPPLKQAIGKRRQKRMKMVLPVRVWARDAANKPVLELAHTLDITPNGARLGAIRHELKAGDKLMLQYHQRKNRRWWWRNLGSGTLGMPQG